MTYCDSQCDECGEPTPRARRLIIKLDYETLHDRWLCLYCAAVVEVKLTPSRRRFHVDSDQPGAR